MIGTWDLDAIEKMNEDDFPFYLAVNNNLKAESLQTKEWFKAGPVGINKLNGLMKNYGSKSRNKQRTSPKSQW